MRIFASKAFHRFTRREAIDPEALVRAAREVVDGRWDADLGGGVFKQRIARAGAGKSGGYRTILLFRVGSAVYFVHGFAKSDRANISRLELVAFRRAADVLTTLSPTAVAAAIAAGELIEVTDEL